MPRLLLVAATCCALLPHSALHAKAPRRATATAAELISETEAEALADVVAAALETDAVIDLRVNRGDSDARFKRVSGRVVELKNKRLLQLTYKRRGACDLQRNHAFQGDDGAEGTDGDLLPPKKWSARKAVKHALTGGAHAKATVGATRYDLTKGSLTSASCAPAKKTASHDRTKKRVVSDDFLVALNVTNGEGKARPGMERKRKQILRFAELLDHTLSKTDLYDSDSIRLVDEGCGKGYLTFAAHELLKKKSNAMLDVVGVERRRELVDACNWACRDDPGLSFMAGDIAPQGAVDVVVALHACDTATDDALYAAVRGGARAIVAAPCCHKQLRPQLEKHRKNEADVALQAILRHGVLADRHAEAVTDTMRCLALECVGYEARMVEWAPLDHTAKNTMLVATRSDAGTDDAAAQLKALAEFHGVRKQRLCALLDLELPGAADDDAPAPRGRMPQE